jgi:drug/metabolite transporter (DMT)-like permease
MCISLLSPLSVAFSVSLYLLIHSLSLSLSLYLCLSVSVSQIAYMMIGWPVVWYKMLFTNDITPEMRKFPMYKFAIMGLFDTLSNLISTWPIPYLSGTLVNVLSNAVLPLTMIGSVVFLKTRYKKSHFLGCGLVIYGIMVKLMPQLFLGESQGRNGSNPLLWIVLLIVSAIPGAASNIYKEIGLKDTQGDVWYMNAWIGVFQTLFGMLTVPTVAIPWPKPAQIITFSEFPQYFHDANTCWLGDDVRLGDSCSDLIWIFGVFILFNITYNQLMLLIFREGTSVLFTIASAARLPLVDVLLLSKFIAGEAAVNKLSVYDYYSLIILVVGIAVYYSEREVHRREFGTDKEELSDDDYEVADEPILHSPHGGGGHLHAMRPPNLEDSDDETTSFV